MPLRYGGTCNGYFAANLVTSPEAKEFRKSYKFREFIDMSRVSCFLTHTVERKQL